MKKLVSRKDSRIIDLMIAYGPLGYGIYALLVEYLNERKAFRSVDDIERIAYELHADAEIVGFIVFESNLFEIIDGFIFQKVPECKAPAAKSENSENSEYFENSEMTFAVPSDDEASPASKPVTSSQKRRERRKRLRFIEKETPAFLQDSEKRELPVL